MKKLSALLALALVLVAVNAFAASVGSTTANVTMTVEDFSTITAAPALSITVTDPTSSSTEAGYTFNAIANYDASYTVVPENLVSPFVLTATDFDLLIDKNIAGNTESGTITLSGYDITTPVQSGTLIGDLLITITN